MFKVYWTNADNQPCSDDFVIMTEALSLAESLRSKGYRFVTMASENPDSIGRSGVDSIVDGRLPGGEEYTWRKRR